MALAELTTEQLEGALQANDIAWDVSGNRVIVTEIGTVGVHIIAIVRVHPEGPNEYGTGSWVAAHFAGDLMPESHDASMKRMSERPSTIGTWPRWKQYDWDRGR